MSWIKDNKFIVSLGGGTLLGVILLYLAGSRGATGYDEAKTAFEESSGAAAGYEKLSPYPKKENSDAKRKAVDEYRKSVESLQGAFKAYRPGEKKNISSQEFTNNLLAANTEIRAAFEGSKTIVPEAFFVGFEKYKSALAPDKATGVLNYELDGIKSVLLKLAAARPSELRNVVRPALPEEDGKAFTPGAADAYRRYPLELTFIGTEGSMRDFFSSIVKPDGAFVTVKLVRVASTKKEPPRSSDAKFDKPAAEKSSSSSSSSSSPFGGGFVIPDESAPAAAAASAPKAPDSSRILSQVLGAEQVQVFVRLEILEFLGEKKLP